MRKKVTSTIPRLFKEGLGVVKQRTKSSRTSSRPPLKGGLKKKKFFVYILECFDKTLYCGSTLDLEKRLHAHNNLKSGAKYTSGRRPVKLVYSEQLKSFGKMREREAEIKRMAKQEKKRLIIFF